MARTTYKNRCLAFMSDEALSLVVPHLSPVTFEIGDVVHEAGRPVGSVLFVETGLVSCITPMSDGAAVESLTIGPDNAVGLACGAGTTIALRRAEVQVEGTGLTIDAAKLRELAETVPEIRDMTVRATAALIEKLLQSVACNARHSLEQRFARRLLACMDASPAKRFALTQDGLAESLGVRRTSVTATAKAMRDDGIINYRHGRIWIEDAEALRGRACECRSVIQRQVALLLPPHGE